MANVLMGWELGEGLGHVHKLLRVAGALREHGHKPVFALFNVVEPWSVLKEEGFPVLQAPLWHARPWRGEGPFLASGFADILAIRGWDCVASLFPLVAAWQRLLDSVKPALIVADFSPTLCLTAFQTLPLILLGSWFSLPPGTEKGFPILVPGQPPVMPQEELLLVAQEVQRRRERPIPGSLPEILTAATCFPAVLPELDPYRELRQEATWDPIDSLPAPMPPAPPSFFAYLTADNAQTEPILTHLSLTGFRGTVFVRNAPQEVQERLRLLGLTVLDRPAPLTDMLAQHAVIVHHGGLGTSHTALAAGRPHILLPQHLEQTTTAQLLRQLGVAINMGGKPAPQSAARALKQILHEPGFADRATSLAEQIHNRPRRDSLPAILEKALSLLA